MGTSEQTLNGANHAFIRYSLQMTIMAIIIKIKKLEFLGPKEHFKLLMSRGVIGSASIILKFFAIKFIRPSEVAALKNCHVIATTILAKFFLNEILTVVHFMAIFLTLFGIALISRPEILFESRDIISSNLTLPQITDTNDLDHSKYDSIIGVVLILISSIFLGSTQVILRKLGTYKVHFANTNIYPSFVGLPASSLISIVLFSIKKNVNQDEKIMIELDENSTSLLIHLCYSIFGGLFGILAITCLSKSLEYEEASRVNIYGLKFYFSFIKLFLL
jgi:drug/metabolite transporter (DMT)-like permease